MAAAEAPAEEPEREPQLSYDVLGGDVRDFAATERITAVGLNSKILALGTAKGRVHVLDYAGNRVGHS
jgi:hypothetical protein